MFLHIGGNKLVPFQDIVAILDLEASKKAEATREFLQYAASQKRVQVPEAGEYKSCVITGDKLFYSVIASTTLAKRILEAWKGLPLEDREES